MIALPKVKKIFCLKRVRKKTDPVFQLFNSNLIIMVVVYSTEIIIW